MAHVESSDARLNFRLPSELKQTIESAAALTGQTVSDFAIAALVRSAQSVIDEHGRTELTNRDRDLFIALLDKKDAKPNKALVTAARRYKKKMS